jgi:hypothetical protein
MRKSFSIQKNLPNYIVIQPPNPLNPEGCLGDPFSVKGRGEMGGEELDDSRKML